MKVLVAQLCPTLCDSVDCSRQAPLSMGFSREHWSGLPCPPPGDLPDLVIEPSLQADSLPSEPPRKTLSTLDFLIKGSFGLLGWNEPQGRDTGGGN